MQFSLTLTWQGKAVGLGLIWHSAGILRTLAITWPQRDWKIDKQHLGAAQVHGIVSHAFLLYVVGEDTGHLSQYQHLKILEY